MIQRLQLPDDEALLRTAYRWDADYPRWWREMDRVFNSGTENDFIDRSRNSHMAYIGVFDGDDLIALVIVETPAPAIHEGHLLVRRGANTALITAACVTMISDLFNLGMTHLFVWVAERHTGLRKMCANMTLQPDGLVMWRGSYHRKYHREPIKWLRFSISREAVFGMTQAA